jgi:hypothetical protein
MTVAAAGATDNNKILQLELKIFVQDIFGQTSQELVWIVMRLLVTSYLLT